MELILCNTAACRVTTYFTTVPLVGKNIHTIDTYMGVNMFFPNDDVIPRKGQ
jgi:hypothetical protein